MSESSRSDRLAFNSGSASRFHCPRPDLVATFSSARAGEAHIASSSSARDPDHRWLGLLVVLAGGITRGGLRFPPIPNCPALTHLKKAASFAPWPTVRPDRVIRTAAPKSPARLAAFTLLPPRGFGGAGADRGAARRAYLSQRNYRADAPPGLFLVAAGGPAGRPAGEAVARPRRPGPLCWWPGRRAR